MQNVILAKYSVLLDIGGLESIKYRIKRLLCSNALDLEKRSWWGNIGKKGENYCWFNQKA